MLAELAAAQVEKYWLSKHVQLGYIVVPRHCWPAAICARAPSFRLRLTPSGGPRRLGGEFEFRVVCLETAFVFLKSAATPSQAESDMTIDRSIAASGPTWKARDAAAGLHGLHPFGPLIPPPEFIEEVKANMRFYVNRTGLQPPESLTRGELSLWLLVKEDGTAMGVPYTPNPTAGAADFYVENGCCLTCGVPQSVAPDLVGWSDENAHCYWKKQPRTSEELDQALKVLDQQELGCHRYAGSDSEILARVAPEHCDHPIGDVGFPAPSDGDELTTLPANGPGFLRRLLFRLKSSGSVSE